MSERFPHPGYEPPDHHGHWLLHEREHIATGRPFEMTFEDDRIASCSICDPMIKLKRWAWSEDRKREAIEVPLKARIAELEADLRQVSVEAGVALSIWDEHNRANGGFKDMCVCTACYMAAALGMTQIHAANRGN